MFTFGPALRAAAPAVTVPSGALIYATFAATGSTSSKVPNLGSLGGELDLTNGATLVDGQLSMGLGSNLATCTVTYTSTGISNLPASTEYEVTFTWTQTETSLPYLYPDNPSISLMGFGVSFHGQYDPGLIKISCNYGGLVFAGGTTWGPSGGLGYTDVPTEEPVTIKCVIDASRNMTLFINGVSQPIYAGSGVAAVGTSDTVSFLATAGAYEVDTVTIRSTL